MPYYLNSPNASAPPPFVLTSEDGNPHLTFEARKRATNIWKWVNDEIQRIPVSFGFIRCTAELRKYGYLAINVEVSDDRLQSHVDEIARIAMRASNGCCEFCDNPGNTFTAPGWLTTLCQSCQENALATPESKAHSFGEHYDLAA